MTDWNNPSTSQTHTNELASTKGRDESNALMDYSSDSNIPDGTIRWNKTNSRFEIWDAGGASWSELTSKYAIDVTEADNADTLGTRSPGNAAGNIPINNGTVNSNLNADLLDGEHSAFYNDTPDGTKMLFYQASAPTGWTQDTSVNDRVLRVVSGSGGGSGGSWTITGVTVDGHVLTESEMPSHDHGSGSLSTDNDGYHDHSYRIDRSFSIDQSSKSWINDADGAFTNNTGNFFNDGAIGGAGSHSHNVNSGTTGSAGGDGSHSHGLTSDGTWRPSHVDVIAATRSK